jgi:hypothetical protein
MRLGLLSLSNFQYLHIGEPEGGSCHRDYVCSVYGKCNLGFIRNTVMQRVARLYGLSRIRCRTIQVSFGPMAEAMSHVLHIRSCYD